MRVSTGKHGNTAMDRRMHGMHLSAYLVNVFLPFTMNRANAHQKLYSDHFRQPLDSRQICVPFWLPTEPATANCHVFWSTTWLRSSILEPSLACITPNEPSWIFIDQHRIYIYIYTFIETECIINPIQTFTGLVQGKVCSNPHIHG